MLQLPPLSHCARASQFGAAWAGAARAIGAPTTRPARAIRATLRPVLERSLAIWDLLTTPARLALSSGSGSGQESAGQVRRGELLGLSGGRKAQPRSDATYP